MIEDKLGQKTILPVQKKVDFGYYLGSEEDKVLLPKKEAGRDSYETGDEVEVFIYKDSADRLIATTLAPALQLGQVARLSVAAVGKIGAFLSWGLTKDLLLPFKQQTTKVQAGDSVLAALYVDKSKRLCATMKVYPHLQRDSSYVKDDEVSGTVYEISANFGAFVAVDDRYSALVPRREMPAGLQVLDQVTARVSEVHPDGKLDLSLRKKAFQQMDEDAALIVAKLQAAGGRLPFTDKSDPAAIKAEFGFSKNAYKRAVGRLLKEEKIRISEKDIELL